MKTNLSVAMCFAVLLAFKAVFTSIACAADIDRHALDSLLAKGAGPEGPALAVGIADEAGWQYLNVRGHANLKGKIAATQHSAFNLASLSKQFTAAAIVVLQQQGQLSFVDTLAKHWPEVPAFMHDIQIDHLLYMTSGLPEYYDLPSPKGGWDSEDQFTVNDAIEAVFLHGALRFEPGSKWQYSNTNYQLLAKLVERKSGMSLAAFSQKHLFGPLSMTDSWIDAPIKLNRKHRTRAYVYGRLIMGGWREAPRESPHYGGSGMYASLNDLRKWHDALFRTHLLGKRFSEQMLATKMFAHDKTNDALGLVHDSFEGEKVVWYAGSDYGVSTHIEYLSEKQLSVICLANYGRAACSQVVASVVKILNLR